ncbi:DNA repair protein RecN [Pseudofulvimonas gallinarii]|uniref:DNA repair protein RecN n=1 Tax=Pseudofulvimonas gallinarii TaxID=634155 RepID=A0A4R3LDG3_9GAMM|nr:DNA repair protein RecN [Pseudofulvimonas gallinarii]TCS96324.1 DNA replication and repair protein RecN [Pseudofulvimonas gallinarii]THD14775.1 DNA repair protein RecN [Pseudofulvimonas gallinarii]
MLTQLTVRDFAIVEAVELTLGAGLTVVSGETGAGKSLLVDALLLLSGTRADSGVVRAGCERAELAAAFDLAALPAVRAWLAERDLDDDDQCLLRRVIRSEGASRAWINGRPVPAQTLAELATQLVEIHGQHEHQALLDRAAQLDLLDRHGDHGTVLAQVARTAGAWRDLERQRKELARQGGSDPRHLDHLRHELAELQRHALAAEALAELEQEHHRLSHQGDTLAACADARRLLDDEGAVLSQLVRARQQLENAAGGDPGLGAVIELLAAAEVEVRESVQALDRHLDGADLDPDRLAQIDAQLSRLHDLARKHRVPVPQLAERRDALAEELASAENAGEALAQLDTRQAGALSSWREAAARLSRARRDTAARLSAQVTALMAELGMAGGAFRIELDDTGDGVPDPMGSERCEFLVSANPGQPLRPLRKVASGGELSRIALAIEVAALGDDPVPTMVFDEVDSGVGGAVAEILGQKLRRLGGHAQVLCVTHLPQVAAQGHRHIRVHKQAQEGHTRTQLDLLDDEARLQEIARMLGGVELTEATYAHARQMLERARQEGGGWSARRRMQSPTRKDTSPT